MTNRSELRCGEDDATASRSELRCGEDDGTASRSEIRCGEDATTSSILIFTGSNINFFLRIRMSMGMVRIFC